MMTSRLVLLVYIGLLNVSIHSASAQRAVSATPDPNEVQSAVQFALQCNATFGTIENVTITSVSTANPGFFTVRGTYHQKIGGLNVLHLRTTDTIGGVFEGSFDGEGRKLQSLQFKISLRGGAITGNCLR
jgi:Cu/Ag efflux pump CusA